MHRAVVAVSLVVVIATGCSGAKDEPEALSGSASIPPTASVTADARPKSPPHPDYPKPRCRSKGRQIDPGRTTLGTADVWPGRYDRGFGEVQPDWIFNGGDPSGQV